MMLPKYFSTLSHKGKKLLNVKYVFRFSLQLLSETFLIRRRTERDIIDCLSFLLDLMKPELSRQIL